MQKELHMYHRMILTAALCAIGAPVAAQSQCGGLADMLAGLHQTYGENPRVSGLMTGGDVLLITAAPGGGWTALGVTADGQACILAAGEAFEVQPAPIPGVDG
jgi:hypothetical protein